jgi:hypothetical protein
VGAGSGHPAAEKEFLTDLDGLHDHPTSLVAALERPLIEKTPRGSESLYGLAGVTAEGGQCPTGGCWQIGDEHLQHLNTVRDFLWPYLWISDD